MRQVTTSVAIADAPVDHAIDEPEIATGRMPSSFITSRNASAAGA